MNHKKELLRGLRVGQRALNGSPSALQVQSQQPTALALHCGCEAEVAGVVDARPRSFFKHPRAPFKACSISFFFFVFSGFAQRAF